MSFNDLLRNRKVFESLTDIMPEVEPLLYANLNKKKIPANAVLADPITLEFLNLTSPNPIKSYSLNHASSREVGMALSNEPARAEYPKLGPDQKISLAASSGLTLDAFFSDLDYKARRQSQLNREEAYF